MLLMARRMAVEVGSACSSQTTQRALPAVRLLGPLAERSGGCGLHCLKKRKREGDTQVGKCESGREKYQQSQREERVSRHAM
jgi:hypothetical protein